MFMGHTGWRNVTTGKFKVGPPNEPLGPKWRPVIENVDCHLNETRPYKLRVISLWQPYASLLFTTAKVHETRGWVWPEKMLGEQVGIHAAQKMDWVTGPLRTVCVSLFGEDFEHTLPRGAILGAMVAASSTPTDSTPPDSAEDVWAGDWSPGRFATRMRSRTLWPKPLPWKGQQGFWTVTDEELNAVSWSLEQ